MNFALDPRPRLRRREIHVHKMVKETAEQLAHELFDAIMTRQGDIWDAFRAQFPGRTTAQLERIFVAHHWPKAIPTARATLAGMLHQGVSPGLDEATKMSIHEALAADATLMRGRSKPVVLPQDEEKA